MGVTKFTRPVQLRPDMQLAGFCSGQEFVDTWLAQRAQKAKERGSAVVYVTHPVGADPVVQAPSGFYTLSSASIERDAVEGGWLRRNAPSQVPVILLGVLGVDRRYQGSGLGRMLLRDAAARSLAVADVIGARALVVDPIDQQAASFYALNGFVPIPGLDRMFAPLSRPAG